MQRFTILRGLLFAMVVILSGRLYQLQFVESDEWKYGSNVEINTTRYVLVRPQRGDILANDGKTLLAESVPTFSVAVMPGQLPEDDPERRAFVLGKLAQITQLTSTMTLSPSLALRDNPALYRDLLPVVGEETLARSRQFNVERFEQLTFTIAPTNTIEALDAAERYEDILTLQNPIEKLIAESNTQHYRPVVVKNHVPRSLALAVYENQNHLPGAVVVEDYQRHYPQSAFIPSFSHLIGYIGRINECELVTENPAMSWLDSLQDVVGHVTHCGILPKQINTGAIGIPPYQNDDRLGKDGLEASYEDELRGEVGIDTLLVDALERPVSGRRTMRPVHDGHNLILTIDAEFQRKTEAILRRWIDEGELRRQNAEEPHKHEYKPITNGAAVVLDARDGRVLAMVSVPTYNNNVWVNPSLSGQLQELLSPSDPEKREELIRLSPLTNRAIAGQYAPGSSLKQFVASVALEKGVVTPGTALRDPGKIILDEKNGRTFTLPNSTRTDNGWITIAEALKMSSNVFFASISGGNDEVVNLGPNDTRITGLRIDRMAEGLEWFGLGQSTQVRLPGEAVGRVPSPIWKAHTLREPWTTGDTYNASIGQGYVEVTPLQLAAAASAVVNGGTIHRPQLVQNIVNSEGMVVEQFEPEVVRTVPVDPTYFDVVRQGMRLSVVDGMNVAARNECSGLSIAGKTGTAEYGGVIETAEGKLIRRSHAWFVGFAPYEDPEIVVVVLLEGAGDMNNGSATLAVPAVTQILQEHFRVAPPAQPPGHCPWMPPLPNAT